MGVRAATDTRTKAANRALILEAAPRVLRRTGLVGFGLPEVAKEAGLARQTIYNHFAGRDDLLAELLVQEMLGKHLPMQEALGQLEPSVDSFVTIILAELAAGRDYSLYDDMLSPSSAPRIVELVFSSAPVIAAREAAWLPILESYEEAGVLRPGLDHREVVRWLTWQTFWILTHPGTLCEDTEEAHARVIRTYIAPGLLTDG